MHVIFVLILFSRLISDNASGFELTDSNDYVRAAGVKTLHGNRNEPPAGGGSRTLSLTMNDDHNNNAVDFDENNDSPVPGAPATNNRLKKRSVEESQSIKDQSITQTINHLNDSHKQLMVHWIGEGSNVIICLARDPTPTIPLVMPVGPSTVYISYDYGDTFTNKTDLFRMSNGSYASLDKFYSHPKYNTHFVFADVRNKLLFVTTNHGRDIKRINLTFTPSDVSFHDLQPSVFVVLDKTDARQKLWLTEDFGNSFQVIQEFVESFHWIKNVNDEPELIVQRLRPTGFSNIIHAQKLFKYHTSQVYATDVHDFYIKNDYLFTTKTSSTGNLELYVSYKLGVPVPCKFSDNELKHKSYFIVDVTSNRALVAISHNDHLSHLYVSEDLHRTDLEPIKFTLSLEDVLCYFPNNTWHNTWIRQLSDEAFADVYKVEGLNGIYIASRVIGKPSDSNLAPQYLGSMITFDHGRSWRLIQAPLRDIEGQPISCSINNNCSLHLSQRFSQLYPDTRSISILSSKSAPGIILATGVLGKSLKGHYGVYISTDAGLTWRQTLRDLYFFNMGDHGGILTAVKYLKSRGETRHVLHSTDGGETWNQTAFHDEDIRLYGLMTEPGENTTVFTMFGSLPQMHQWIIVKLDFIKVFKYNCTKDDYKIWTPRLSEENRSYVPCVLGQQLTYQRRMPHANCYNGLDFDTPISMRPCQCDIYDYECDFGFVRANNQGNCIQDKSLVDFKPYKIPDNCKPGNFYQRTKGYRKIQGDVCVNGFKNHYLPDLVPCPFNEADDFLLFAQRERISRFNLITKQIEELPIRNLKNVIAVDFDMKRNCVYWADNAMDTIGRQCFNGNNTSDVEILVSSDLASIEGMALDWISNTLYFVDGTRSKIELIRTDINHSGRMRRTILGPDVLKKPRGIALHPKSGYMFWTDWSADNPSVNRANLDGTNIKQLFGKPRVEWPNGITIDYIAERIYWVDARQDYIASSDLHGFYFKLIISHDDVVSHPFAVAVFKNNMYWDDWKRNAIFSADKDSFHGVEVLVKQLPGLMDLKVYAHGIQIGTNACSNKTSNTCSYICVGAPQIGHSSCLCPDGMDMMNGNKCLCPGGMEPFSNLTCSRVANSCSSAHFSCNNGLCIPKSWRCDAEDDCGDMSDERQCDTKTCPPSYHVCGDGRCLPLSWRCDLDMDCTDGSDESNCEKQNCTSNQFTCANGRCISMKWKCDGENDCRDGSDEQNCAPPEPSVCKGGEFRCKTGALRCIPPTWICDGEKDCRDGTDENDCVNNTCLPDIQYSCGPPSNRCIYKSWLCDGDKDCPDGRDEKNCSTNAGNTADNPNKNIDQFTAHNGTCHDWMFKCNNQKCIPYWWKCDQADDCNDNSDEIGCPEINTINNKNITTTTTSVYNDDIIVNCGKNEFHCHSDNRCIFSSWICDGSKDCTMGEDEADCSIVRKCETNEFKCRVDGSCIHIDLVCNQKLDCPDGTDELYCNQDIPSPSMQPATPSCSIGYFPCDGNICYPLASLCDGKADCKDGYDEQQQNCTKSSRIYQVLQMGVDERSINESSLLLYWWIPSPINNNVVLEFLPSISKVVIDDNRVEWHNQTWIENSEFKFTALEPFTKYNMTIYVRVRNTNAIFPPAKYYIANTGEGVPTEPWNVTAIQKNGSHILISWNKPTQANGQITNYKICWYPPMPSIKLKLSGNETSHLLAADFQQNIKYTFYVIAINRKHESKSSITTTLTFDSDSDLDSIGQLQVLNQTDTSILLKWQYHKIADGFQIKIETHPPYPKLVERVTKSTNITIDNLAPGVHYTFKVNAYKKSFVGLESSVSAVTSGAPLPEVTGIHIELVKQFGTTVRLNWTKPNDLMKQRSNSNWTFGIYYGLDEEELFEKPRYQTSNLQTTIMNLGACEKYLFSVGIIGPFGYGPLSSQQIDVTTSVSKEAPPKNLTITSDVNNQLKMIVKWSPSCPADDYLPSYIIKVHERNQDKLWYTKKERPTNLSHTFDINYGGIYEVSIATGEPDAIYTSAVQHNGPPIMPPCEVKSFVENNGSFIVYWQKCDDLPKDDGSNYNYELLVSVGNELNESNAQIIPVKEPPFIYTNFTSTMYTFAVRVAHSVSGFKSLLSEQISIKRDSNDNNSIMSSTTLSLAIGSTIIIIVAFVVITIVVCKHRRLQNSFTRFANSHYDKRSGAATFDDNNGLDEDDSPQITGFSDDEPLVIA